MNINEDEKEELIKQLQIDVLQVFNERLIKAGINEAEDAIYIASVAMAQAAAVLTWSQMPLNALTPEVQESLLNDWCELYKQYAREIVRKRKDGYNGEPITASNTQEEEPGDDEVDTDESAWGRRR